MSAFGGIAMRMMVLKVRASSRSIRKATDKRILKLLDKPPPAGYARWTGPLLAGELGDVDVPNRQLHVILDNLSTHKQNEEWLEAHPNVKFHFTPTSASWLNQVEVWYSIL